MKIGLSTYSLVKALQAKELDILGAIEWISKNGGEHVEIVPMGFDLLDNPALIQAIKEKAAQVGIELSNYSVGANFAGKEGEAYEAEIAQVMRHVDVAQQLGVKLMRHDVATRPIEETGIAQFEADLPKLVEACQRVADYAAQFGITTSVENHGYFVQASDRVQRLIHEVNRPNYKTTLDIGNFMCVDENSVSAVKKNISYASIVHLKDFYWRPANQDPGEGWFPTSSGNYLRGAIVGQGDIAMRDVIRVVKESGYDGYITIEFEGMEESKLASRIGMANARRIWDEV